MDIHIQLDTMRNSIDLILRKCQVHRTLKFHPKCMKILQDKDYTHAYLQQNRYHLDMESSSFVSHQDNSNEPDREYS